MAGLVCLAGHACSSTSLTPTNIVPTNQISNTPALGTQNLADPTVGLNALSAYLAVLKIGFSGTQGGKSSDWTETYTLAVDTAHGTRLLSIQDSGLPQEASMQGWVYGTYQGMSVTRNGDAYPCSAAAVEAGDQPTVLEPASRIPSVLGAATAPASGNIQGIAVEHFTFNQSAIDFPGKGEASGEMWLAGTGGFLVKYSLSATGGPDFFGQDMNGKMTWDYQIGSVNSSPSVMLPDNCPPGLVDAPLFAGAQVLTNQPGVLEFNAAADLKSVADFYQGKLPALGYTAGADPVISDSFVELAYQKPGLVLDIDAQKTDDNLADVLITLQRENPTLAANPPAAAATPGVETNQNPTQLIAMAMGKLLGDENTPSVFPSYLLSMNESLPSASGNAATTLQVDAQGANYHFVLSSSGTQTDAIHFNGQDYSVVSGKAQPGSALLALNWAMWKLDPGVMFGAAAGSTITPQAGTTLEGRQIDVYSVDSSTLGTPLPDTSMGLLPYVITAIQGTIWIDHATGGLVKADLQFAANVKKPGQTAPGASGKGEFHLAVSQIGQVTVSLP